jgi:hypothetical protein
MMILNRMNDDDNDALNANRNDDFKSNELNKKNQKNDDNADNADFKSNR